MSIKTLLNALLMVKPGGIVVSLEVHPDYTERAQSEDPTIEGVFVDKLGNYIVEKYRISSSDAFEYRLAIKRSDKEPIRTWRLLQDIENDIVGVDAVAIEVYPREAEVTDTANIYHLWVYKDGYAPNVSLVPSDKRV